MNARGTPSQPGARYVQPNVLNFTATFHHIPAGLPIPGTAVPTREQDARYICVIHASLPVGVPGHSPVVIESKGFNDGDNLQNCIAMLVDHLKEIGFLEKQDS